VEIVTVLTVVTGVTAETETVATNSTARETGKIERTIVAMRDLTRLTLRKLKRRQASHSESRCSHQRRRIKIKSMTKMLAATAKSLKQLPTKKTRTARFAPSLTRTLA